MNTINDTQTTDSENKSRNAKCPDCGSDRFVITEEVFTTTEPTFSIVKIAFLFCTGYLILGNLGLVPFNEDSLGAIACYGYIVIVTLFSVVHFLVTAFSWTKTPTSRTKFTCLDCEHQHYIGHDK